MPYIRKICVAGKTTEVSKYHSQRWDCKGEKRSEKEKETSVQQEKINQRQASEKLRLSMNTNFKDGDSYLTLDFKKELRPGSIKEFQEMASDFVTAVKKDLRREHPEMQFKYIYVKEIGPKGAAHLHMVTNVRDMEVIRKNWPWGGVHLDPLNTDGQYADLADYFVKYADKTVKTEGKLAGKRWYCSYNLEKPLIVKVVIKRVDTFSEKPTIPKQYGEIWEDWTRPPKYGDIRKYYVEGDSVMRGVNELGYGFFSYTLHELPDSPYLYRERPDLMKNALKGDKAGAGG